MGAVTKAAAVLSFMLPSVIADAGDAEAVTTARKKRTGGHLIDNGIRRSQTSSSRPAQTCSDDVFLRRSTLIMCGRPPTLEECRSYHQQTVGDRRAWLIDYLLEHPDTSQRWATWLTRWTGCHRGLERQIRRAASRMRVPPESLSAMWVAWLRVRIQADMPYDEIVRGFLLATTRDGREDAEAIETQHRFIDRVKQGEDGTAEYATRQTNDLFWRVHLENRDLISNTVSEAFLGINIECARCHDHPDGKWTQNDFKQFHAIFDRLTHSKAPPIALKRRITLARSLSLGGAGVLACLFGLSLGLFRSGHRNSAHVIAGLSLSVAGAGIYVAAGLSHLLWPTVSQRVISPGIWIANAWLGNSSGGALFHAVMAVMALVAIICFVWGLRRLSVPGRVAGRVLAATLVAVAVVFAATATDASIAARQPTAGARQPLVNQLRRRWHHDSAHPGLRRETEIYLEPVRDDTTSAPALFDRTPVAEAVASDPRRTLLDWMVDPAQRELDETIIGRTWREFFGTALNEESDQQLLDDLVTDFRQHKRSLHHLYRLILSSQTFQLTSANALSQPQRFVCRQLPGHHLLAAVAQAMGADRPIALRSPGVLPRSDENGQDPADMTWSRGTRVLGAAPGQGHALDTDAAMFLLVDPGLHRQLTDPSHRIARLLARGSSPRTTLETLYMASLTRRPSQRESTTCLAHVASASDKLAAWADIQWALLNSREFQLIR